MALGQEASDHLLALVPGEFSPDPLLQRVVVGDGEGHELLQAHVALAVALHQDGAHRAKPQALLHHGRRHAEAGGDVLGTLAVLHMQPGEGFILIGGVHGCLEDILGKAHFLAGEDGHERARNGIVFEDHLTLRQQFQRSKAAASGHHLKLTGLLAFAIQDGPDGHILQEAVRNNRGGQFFDAKITPGLPHIGERGNELRQGDHADKGFVGHMGHSVSAGFQRKLGAETLPVGETGGGKGKGGGGEGYHPICTSPKGAEDRGYAAPERSGPCARQGRSPSENKELVLHCEWKAFGGVAPLLHRRVPGGAIVTRKGRDREAGSVERSEIERDRDGVGGRPSITGNRKSSSAAGQ